LLGTLIDFIVLGIRASMKNGNRCRILRQGCGRLIIGGKQRGARENCSDRGQRTLQNEPACDVHVNSKNRMKGSAAVKRQLA
jgi:hypothetical protein